MARARNIKPGFFTNEVLAEVHPLGRLLFAGLWTIADRAGRLEDRPKKIKVEVLPYDDCSVDKLLDELAAHGFIQRYEADGGRFVQITAFLRHQNPHVKEPPSEIPAPAEPGASTGPEPGEPGASTVTARRIPSNGFRIPLVASSCDSKPAPANGLAFPVVGDPSARTWPIPPAKLAEYRETFPSLDVEAEMLKALQWLRDHPHRLKTAKGMTGFLSSWLGRAADGRAPGGNGNGRAGPASAGDEAARREKERLRRLEREEHNRRILAEVQAVGRGA